jgi:glycosidase
MSKRRTIISIFIALLVISAALPGSTAAPPKDEIYYHIFTRSFYDSNGDRQGDFRGIIAKLDYIQDLGATSIWLNPIYSSSMYHNYFASDFMNVDREFGTIDDFRALCTEVHRRGMKILIDMETVYVAGDHPWFRDSYANPASSFGKLIRYNGPGNTDPEPIVFGLTEIPGYDGKSTKVATLNLSNPDIMELEKKIYSFWLDPNGDGDLSDGVDGYRMDHIMDDLDDKDIYPDLLAGFWKPIVDHARSIKPDCFFLAEQAAWGSGGVDIMERGSMDAVFGIPLCFAFVESLEKGDAQPFMAQLVKSEKTVPKGKKLLNVIENHDLPRFASVCGGFRPETALGAVILMTLPGTPCIYYGQEIGMKGTKIPDADNDGSDIPMREPFEWYKINEGKGTAFWYKGIGEWEKYSQRKSADGISVEEQISDKDSLLNLYKKLIAIRRGSSALRTGSTVPVDTGSPCIAGYARISADGDCVAVIANLSKNTQSASAKLAPLMRGRTAARLRDLLTSSIVKGESGTCSLTLKPYEAKLIRIE